MRDCVESALRGRHQLVEGSQASHPPLPGTSLSATAWSVHRVQEQVINERLINGLIHSFLIHFGCWFLVPILPMPHSRIVA